MPVIRKEIAMRYSERGAGTPRFQNYLTKGFFRDFFEKHRPEQLPNTASAVAIAAKKYHSSSKTKKPPRRR